jgi:tRNA(Ile)-lysidine synthase TilS/MesJ
MIICTKCILNEKYPKITFDIDGTCSLCKKPANYKPFGEGKLQKIFEKARSKNASYDALVPLSGGKDSSYILHLAVNVYKLKVLAMTWDNGFLSPLALTNIRRAIEITQVKHIFCKPDPEVRKKIYRIMLLSSGDMCGACDIGTKANIIKVAQDHSIPVILYGTSPLEEDSFVPDSIQDVARLKYILSRSKELSKKEINGFLIYPNLNNVQLSFNKRVGKFGKEVRPLFYLMNLSDKEIGEIITRELDWKDDNREFSKHFDCIAEPFTNYIRNKIYGYERRLCQFSNMIRKNEISRASAMKLYNKDNIDTLPDNYPYILNYLDLTENDLEKITGNTPLKYEKHISKMNILYSNLMGLKNKLIPGV